MFCVVRTKAPLGWLPTLRRGSKSRRSSVDQAPRSANRQRRSAHGSRVRGIEQDRVPTPERGNERDRYNLALRFFASCKNLRSCLVKMDPSIVLGYGAFGPVTGLRDRTARLTQPTLNAGSARTGSAEGHGGVGCVETLVRV